jgi:cytochrome P450
MTRRASGWRIILTTAEMIDMCDEELMQEPYGGYSRIRERDPLVRGVMKPVGPTWVVTRYNDVKQVLTDARFVVNPAHVPGPMERAYSEVELRKNDTPTEYIKYKLARMGQADGAGHVRLRSPVAAPLTADRVARLRPRAEAIAEGLLDRLPKAADDNGVVDLLPHFANPLPAAVLFELIGIPGDDQRQWQHWLLEHRRTDVTMEHFAQLWHDMVTYAEGLIERRRREPADDLISMMIHTDVPGEPPSDTEIVAMMMMDHNAHLAVGHLIANGTVALLTHPEQLALLREDRRLIPGAVHELLRFCGPTTISRMRHPTEDVPIAGQTVRKGEALWAIIASANRDPRRFAAPDRLDVTRPPHPSGDPHLAFGDGPHICLGRALTTLIGEVAFEALLRRLPLLTLAVAPTTLIREPKPRQWGLTALPIHL